MITRTFTTLDGVERIAEYCVAMLLCLLLSRDLSRGE